MDLTLYFDGACEPRNPGGVATCGWLIFGPDGDPIAFGCKVVADGGATATNNFAEWCALGLGLRWLLDNRDAIPQLPDELSSEKGLPSASLSIFGDSQLVIEQLNGRWRCNKAHLIKLRDRCLELLDELRLDWSAAWIPREDNELADGLSRRAYCEYTGRAFPERRRRRVNAH